MKFKFDRVICEDCNHEIEKILVLYVISFEQKLDRFFDKNKRSYKFFQNLSRDTGPNNETVELLLKSSAEIYVQDVKRVEKTIRTFASAYSDTHNKLLLLRWFNENISLKDIKQSQKCSYESKRHKRHQEIRDNNNQALDDSTKYFGSAIKRLELIKRRMGRSDKKRPVSEKSTRV
ncbi:hypothetical protein GLOIN_2v1770608 [Rhizophagus irregularis DAOM 181602=DAOM 197198]|uniref:Uncharacterized protein n=1 Tax=Rhizophagus irregularis (strain DAOM 181602 / DAOM 197198 / MUCL 43194) TaxID=747089 RepID=A0A2P4QBK9_RHIID|nr:hypothetical protein GLOIN_2v1770608 [Rhizophagus irregularis DAOM 181602=DAOM 197198]POG75006.1 hypothetical protein GLOIN_2v1770608 [Rhizophagus irregularis DAOM 181602=DAOM 197198]CAG8749204.1 15904_t:CDS:2 [Rhizophagus irregularis]|eukprot:XP_025181872.1 hypothetical protein GLOIN_2v1770608 [Rhizophagus irregularis DAOM 181602=DAOM 197198]